MERIEIEQPDAARMDMTPMIDCVFQLLIFFILVTSFSELVLTDLMLPKIGGAEKVRPDNDLLVLSVKPAREDPGRTITTFSGRVIDEPELIDLIGRHVTEYENRDGTSSAGLLIRGDEYAAAGEIQKIIWHCQRATPPLYKVSFGVLDEE